MTRESQRLRLELDSGDVTAFVALADSLADEDDPRAPELCALATDIVSSDDWAIVTLACAVFLQILEGGVQ